MAPLNRESELKQMDFPFGQMPEMLSKTNIQKVKTELMNIFTALTRKRAAIIAALNLGEYFAKP